MKEIIDEHLKQKMISDSNLTNQFSTDIEHDLKLFLIQAQSFIVKNNETPEYLFYMVEGRAKLYNMLSNGKISLIDFFNPPCFIGEMELLDPEIKPYSVQATKDCWCLALPAKKYKYKLLNDVTFLRKLSIYLSYKNIRNISTASKNQSFSLSERFSSFILLTSHNNIYDEKHVQAAQYLGVTYRHLLYVLSLFVKKGYLEKMNKHYLITDKNSLLKLAHDVQNSTM